MNLFGNPEGPAISKRDYSVRGVSSYVYFDGTVSYGDAGDKYGMKIVAYDPVDLYKMNIRVQCSTSSTTFTIMVEDSTGQTLFSQSYTKSVVAGAVETIKIDLSAVILPSDGDCIVWVIPDENTQIRLRDRTGLWPFNPMGLNAQISSSLEFITGIDPDGNNTHFSCINFWYYIGPSPYIANFSIERLKVARLQLRPIDGYSWYEFTMECGDDVTRDVLTTNASGHMIFADDSIIIKPGESIVHDLPSVLAGSIKSDTGDPSSPVEGQITINTADGAIKVYADSAWRTLASW